MNQKDFFSCPACGAEVRFQTSVTVTSVCTYCASVLVRRDIDIESIGKVAQLLGDVSPIQIGTRGSFEKTHFDIAGRAVYSWSEGFWSEWFAKFDDGRSGWLVEAQGFFGMCFERHWETKKTYLSLGQKVSIEGHGSFEVSDIKKNSCVFVEGELPFVPALKTPRTSVDLRGPDSKFATVEQDSIQLFVGAWVPFDNFNFHHLRELDGW